MDRLQLGHEAEGYCVLGNCAKRFASITQFRPHSNSGRLQDHLPFAVRKLRHSEANSLQASQGCEGKQLSQDPKLGPSDSKVYIFQNIPISPEGNRGAERWA